MKPGERLIWELFEFIREVLPVTEANTKRLSEWSARFHAMETGAGQADEDAAEHPSAEDTDETDDSNDDGDDEHPIRHAASRRKKR